MILPSLWLLWHRQFLAAIAVFALQVAIGWNRGENGFLLAELVLPLLLGLFVALEGPSLRAWKLKRKGWRESAVVLAGDEREAEIRYYAGAAQAQADLAASMPAVDEPEAPVRPPRAFQPDAAVSPLPYDGSDRTQANPSEPR